MPRHTKPLIGFITSSETLAGLIYGLVTATAVIAVLADKDADLVYMSLAALGTSLALAFTYVYSHWLAGSYSDDAGHAGWREAWNFEASTLVGPLLLAVVMLGERAIGVDVVAAAEAAMWVATVILFLLGYRIALMGGHSYAAAVGFGVLDATLGGALVLIKVLVH
jgi:hypothetical protein